MSLPPPPLPEQVVKARAKIARAVKFTQASAITLLVLGGISTLVSVLHPLSASFLISIAVVANGAIEWRLAKKLAARDVRAPARLALNQLALGVEIAIYTSWQALHFTAEQIESLLRRPLVAMVLEALDPERVTAVLDLLLPIVRILYLVMGTAALLGCVATAWYYHARRKFLSLS